MSILKGGGAFAIKYLELKGLYYFSINQKKQLIRITYFWCFSVNDNFRKFSINIHWSLSQR